MPLKISRQNTKLLWQPLSGCCPIGAWPTLLLSVPIGCTAVLCHTLPQLPRGQSPEYPPLSVSRSGSQMAAHFLNCYIWVSYKSVYVIVQRCMHCMNACAHNRCAFVRVLYALTVIHPYCAPVCTGCWPSALDGAMCNIELRCATWH